MKEAKLRIYIAGSWKNEVALRVLADTLSLENFQVDLFCSCDGRRYVFSFANLNRDDNDNAKTMLKKPEVQKAFKEDKKWIDWADVVVMALPCGRSAHLEAGYAVGCGKPLFILGPFPKGEYDVMYGFACRLCENICELVSELYDLEEALYGDIPKRDDV